MTKPMYCPFGFANPELANTRGEKNSVGLNVVHCTPDCAWALKGAIDDNYSCAVAIIARKDTFLDINYRPVEDDAK